VALFESAIAGNHEEAFALYRWFLPLLRMDTVPKFIQLIKQVQQEVGVGNARVRPPRLEVTGTELQETRAVVQHALQYRPALKRTAFPK
jgi:4-hydroxy-tetrahydrodipicolinate synthase